MAFKIKRSVIKGTPAYKKAKAKVQAIDVAKGPTGPDTSLVRASELLASARGKTKNIDFTIKQPDFDFSGLGDVKFGERKSKDKVEKTPRVKKEKQPKVKKDRLSLKDRLKNIREDLKTRFDEKKADVLESIWERNQRIAREKQEKQKQKDLIDAGTRDEEEYYEQMMQETPDADFSSDGSSESVDKRYETWREKEYYNLLDEHEARKKAEQMAKKENIIPGTAIPVAIGDSQIRSYSKEEKERLKTEGVFNEEAGRVVLPEEHNYETGEYLPSEWIYDESKSTKKDTITTPKTTIIPEDQTITPTETSKLSSRQQKAQDFKYKILGPDGRKKMIDEGYIPKEDRSPTQMRDDRIFNGAIKGGKVQQNMLKSGYIPPNKR